MITTLLALQILVGYTTIEAPCKRALLAINADEVRTPLNFAKFGIVRGAMIKPELFLGDVNKNADEIIEAVITASTDGASLILLPEMALTGYSIQDQFFNEDLLAKTKKALLRIADEAIDSVVVVGAPYRHNGRLFNTAFVLYQGKILGAVPKIHLPNYREFYDYRWFTSGKDVEEMVDDPLLGKFLLSPYQTFKFGDTTFGIEICEDLFAPHTPSTDLALAGAEVILNLSGSNELVGKRNFRLELINQQSAKTHSAYLYSSAGPGELGTDIVYGGHRVAAVDGSIAVDSARFEHARRISYVDIDLERLRHDRSVDKTFAESKPTRKFKSNSIGNQNRRALYEPRLSPNPHPFIPSGSSAMDINEEILDIQTTGLIQRLRASKATSMVIGLSGGLDSTLAFLVCVRAAQRLGWPMSSIHAITMPGFGTTPRTLENAKKLAEAYGVKLQEIDIKPIATAVLNALNHPLDLFDTVYENTQARARTDLLFNYANGVNGIVIGTGTLSELCQGYCTYNADHMSNYNVNVSVPKTLVAHLIKHIASTAIEVAKIVLEDIVNTPYSAELLPLGDNGTLKQKTEAVLGKYELIDFFIYHFVRNQSSPAKVYAFASLAFEGRTEYKPAEFKTRLKSFLRRFIQSQFKRDTLPPGPKVGTISISPRGDWRFPADISSTLLDEWEKEIDALPDYKVEVVKP